jgi:hypothetical protein
LKTITIDKTLDWLMEKFVSINIYYDNTTQDLYDIFEVINKSIPIPEIYKKDTEEEKKVSIYEMVEELRKRYRVHFSDSPKYNIPNMNRDSLMDILSRYYDKYEKKIEKSEMLDLLLKTNKKIGESIEGSKEKITTNVLNKCKKSGCYLFIRRFEEIEKEIEKEYKEEYIA